MHVRDKFPRYGDIAQLVPDKEIFTEKGQLSYNKFSGRSDKAGRFTNANKSSGKNKRSNEFIARMSSDSLRLVGFWGVELAPCF
jgi:hypothetical protein